MARRRRKLPQQLLRKTQKVEPELARRLAGKRTALFLGAAVLVASAVLATGYFVNQKIINKKPAVPTPMVIPVATELPLTPGPSKPDNATPSAGESAQEQTKKEKGVVKKLPATSSEPVKYSVKPGDTLASIARDFCDNENTWMEIAKQNNIAEPYYLHSGTTLLLSCP